MAAISYIGEALLRLGGGSWVWDEDPASASYDLPLARPDDELDLSPVSPMHLLVEPYVVAPGTSSRGSTPPWNKRFPTAGRTSLRGRRPRRTPPVSISTSHRSRLSI